ncbi:MAG: 50S ribosomal protein L11 methyltransferase [Pseudomonadota bacterium]
MSWKIELIVSRETISRFVELLEVGSASVAYFEKSEGNSWCIQVWHATKPNSTDINARVALLATLLDVPIPTVTIQEAPEKDWVQENLQSFPPIEIGCFYLYGSHIQSALPANKIAFEIDAGMAFGTGSHPTTQGCLLTLEKLAQNTDVRISNVLDLGCGSGILAFACAKLWDCPVMGIDNDPEAIAVAKENTLKNNISNIELVVSEGFAELLPYLSFDLVTANILANPLCELAPQMLEHTKPGGYVVLSGILKEQGERIVHCYQKTGFTLKDQITLGEWVTLTLQKAG